MPIYETVCILHPELSEARVKETIEGMQQTLTAGEANVLEVEEWGMRNLAYEIQKQSRGFYVRLEYESRPQAVTEFERGLRLSEDTLRFLSVARAAPSEGQSPMPAGHSLSRQTESPTPPVATREAAAPATERVADETASAAPQNTDSSQPDASSDSPPAVTAEPVPVEPAPVETAAAEPGPSGGAGEEPAAAPDQPTATAGADDAERPAG